MDIKFIISATCVYLTVVSFNANAVLVERLGGLAFYDTDADLTWLADASYLKTLYVSSGGTEGDGDGRTPWAFANNAVSQLSVAGVTGWRLPNSVDIGGDGCNTSFFDTDCGYNIDPTAGELANLFANVLGRISYKDTGGNVWEGWSQIPSDFGPFSNIQAGYYWSNTRDYSDSAYTMVFSTSTSDQVYAGKTGSSLRTWAVYSGDVELSTRGQGTWASTLQARDLDGNLVTTEAFYDMTLDITWLADAALSKTELFGIKGINPSGQMDWYEVQDWILAMNASSGGEGYLGQSTWRLPIILDDSSTSALLGHNSDTSRSELASLYYDTLGNVSNGGLTNTATFENLQTYYYATDAAYVGDPNNQAWSFAFHSGDQYNRTKSANLYSFVGLDGDVGIAVIDGGTFSVEPSTISTNQSENLTYFFCFENKNGRDATVQVVSDIPTGTAFVTASGSYSTTPSTIIWGFGLVPAGAPRQCVNMVVHVQAVAGSTLVANATIQSDRPFIPGQVKTTIDVVAPTLAITPESDKNSGVFGLLEFFTFLLGLIYRRGKVSKI